MPPLEERRSRARAEFQNLDTNRDGFVERAEAEALVHAEFNQYDTDRDNKVTEPEVRLIVQRSLQREAGERQQIEARRRQGMVTLNDFIDMQLRNADQLDKNNDGKVSQQEYLALAGPADGPQAKNLLPFDLRKQIALRKFAEIDTNKDGVLDRVELTGYAVKQFLEMDLNKDRFLSEEEFKKAQEAESKKIQAHGPGHAAGNPARSRGRRRPSRAAASPRRSRSPLPAWRPACRKARASWSSAPGRYAPGQVASSALFDRDALGEIARLVDVGALGQRRVIGEQLHRDGVEDRRHDRIDVGQRDRRPRPWRPAGPRRPCRSAAPACRRAPSPARSSRRSCRRSHRSAPPRRPAPHRRSARSDRASSRRRHSPRRGCRRSPSA